MQPGGRETPSGLPVPRYVATKFETVNARSGPGDDYATVWTYHTRGLPLQVVAETEEWRRVCDPDGAVAWVHRRTVAETRRVMRTAASDLPLRAHPADGGARGGGPGLPRHRRPRALPRRLVPADGGQDLRLGAAGRGVGRGGRPAVPVRGDPAVGMPERER